MRISDWSSDVCSSDLGIAIYDADGRELAVPKPKTPAQALEAAKEYFEDGFPSAMKRFEIAKFDIERGFLKDAAFDMHQTVERLYSCLLLTLTYYKIGRASCRERVCQYV